MRIDFVRIDLVGVDFVRIDLVGAPRWAALKLKFPDQNVTGYEVLLRGCG